MVYPLISLGSMLSIRVRARNGGRWFCRVKSISSMKKHKENVGLEVEWFWRREDIAAHTNYSQVKILGQLPPDYVGGYPDHNLAECMGNDEVILIQGDIDLIAIGCVDSAHLIPSFSLFALLTFSLKY
jgi:hypothetical protein